MKVTFLLETFAVAEDPLVQMSNSVDVDKNPLCLREAFKNVLADFFR